MIIIRTASALKDYLDKQRRNGSRIGFIPTMGALHEGHISLVDRALNQQLITVVSIFVNPTQFNDPSDYNKYPVTITDDIRQLMAAGAHLLFLPTVAEIYPSGIAQLPHYHLGHIETLLEGKFRPGHFQGVGQVMDRLLNITGACELYMGQKDYQQCMVVKELLEITGKDAEVALHVSPTLRELSGLAMSSRNRRLSDSERERATAIFQSLLYIKNNRSRFSPSELKETVFVDLMQKGFKPDYVSIADADTLEERAEWQQGAGNVALIAAFLGEVRLIDNMLLEE